MTFHRFLSVPGERKAGAQQMAERFEDGSSALPRCKFFGGSLPLLAVALIWAFAAGAQEVVLVLKNGDHVSGLITFESTNEVILSNNWAGKILIPLTMIEKRENRAEGTNQPLNQPFAKSRDEMAGRAAATSTNLQANAAVKPKPKPAQRWHVDAQAGVNLEYSAKDLSLYYGALKLNYNGDRWRDIMEYKANYGRADGVVDANNMFGSERVEYDVSKNKRLFVFDAFSAGYDEIRDVVFTGNDSIGVGYKFVTRTNLEVSGDTGLDYQDEHFTDGQSHSYEALRFSEVVSWKINPRITLDEKALFFPRLNAWGNYRARVESSVNYKLNATGSLYLTLSLIDAYDTLPAPGVTPNDLQIHSTIGVKF